MAMLPHYCYAEVQHISANTIYRLSRLPWVRVTREMKGTRLELIFICVHVATHVYKEM